MKEAYSAPTEGLSAPVAQAGLVSDFIRFSDVCGIATSFEKYSTSEGQVRHNVVLTLSPYTSEGNPLTREGQNCLMPLDFVIYNSALDIYEWIKPQGRVRESSKPKDIESIDRFTHRRQIDNGHEGAWRILCSRASRGEKRPGRRFRWLSEGTLGDPRHAASLRPLTFAEKSPDMRAIFFAAQEMLGFLAYDILDRTSFSVFEDKTHSINTSHSLSGPQAMSELYEVVVGVQKRWAELDTLVNRDGFLKAVMLFRKCERNDDNELLLPRIVDGVQQGYESVDVISLILHFMFSSACQMCSFEGEFLGGAFRSLVDCACLDESCEHKYLITERHRVSHDPNVMDYNSFRMADVRIKSHRVDVPAMEHIAQNILQFNTMLFVPVSDHSAIIAFDKNERHEYKLAGTFYSFNMAQIRLLTTTVRWAHFILVASRTGRMFWRGHTTVALPTPLSSFFALSRGTTDTSGLMSIAIETFLRMMVFHSNMPSDHFDAISGRFGGHVDRDLLASTIIEYMPVFVESADFATHCSMAGREDVFFVDDSVGTHLDESYVIPVSFILENDAPHHRLTDTVREQFKIMKL
jgi:hypothetical protein